MTGHGDIRCRCAMKLAPSFSQAVPRQDMLDAVALSAIGRREAEGAQRRSVLPRPHDRARAGGDGARLQA